VVAHEYAHLLDPHDARNRLFVFIALASIALWIGVLRICADIASAVLLGVWCAGWPTVAGALWCVARIHHSAELRADRTGAQLLGDSRPVLVMLECVASRHITLSAGQRMCTRLTHPAPERRRRALLGVSGDRSALAPACDVRN
jgi:predicted Zn-dependent protease